MTTRRDSTHHERALVERVSTHEFQLILRSLREKAQRCENVEVAVKFSGLANRLAGSDCIIIEMDRYGVSSD